MRLPPRLFRRLSWTGVRAPAGRVARRRQTDGAWLTCAAPVLGTVTRPGLFVTFVLVLALATSALGGILTRSGLLGQGAGDPAAIFPSTLKAWLKADAGVFTDAAADLEAGSSQYFTRNSEAALQVGDIDFVVFGWINLESNTDGRGIFEKGTPFAAGGEFEAYTDIGANTITFGVRKADDSARVAVQSTDVAATATWAFVEFYHDATGDVIGIRIDNGTAVTAALAGGVFTGANALRVGMAVGGANPFDGLESGFGFLRGRLLSVSERAAIYNAGDGVSYADLPATLTAEAASDFHYWPLCESTGARNDQHGTAHLTAVNSPGVAAGPIEIDVAAEEIGNCPVKRWEDQSGNGNHVVQATMASQPLYILSVVNGLPGIQGDNSDDRLDTTTALSGLFTNAAFGFFGAVRPTALTTATGVAYTEHQIVSTSTGGFLGVSCRADGGVQAYNYDGAAYDVVTVAGGAVVDATFRFAAAHDAGNLTLSVDGGADQSAASGNTSSMTDVLRVGLQYDGLGGAFRGYLFEQIIVNAAPSAAQKTAMNTYLARWV